MLFTALCLTSAVTTLIVVLAVLVVFLAVFFALVPVGTWFRALVSGARISMGRLIGMRLRRINIRMIVEAYINAVKAGLEIDVVELETHYMAGGDVLKVVNALISAHSANIDLSLRTAKPSTLRDVTC